MKNKKEITLKIRLSKVLLKEAEETGIDLVKPAEASLTEYIKLILYGESKSKLRYCRRKRPRNSAKRSAKRRRGNER